MSALRELTRVSPSLRRVAALLQSKGRNGDTLLAHINRKEAQMLLDAGGAGTINPETGLLEFYDGGGDFFEPGSGPMEGDVYPPATSAQTFPVADVGPATQETPIAALQQFEEFNPAYYQQYAQPATPAAAPETPASTPSFRPSMDYGPGMTGAETAAFDAGLARGAPIPAAPGLTEEQRQMLTKLGVAGIQSLPGLLMSRRAAGQARASTQQQQQIAQPYQEMGRQLLTQAQAGQLTPQGQQALQAARAQMAQGIQQRGGVGAQQAATQLENFRQTLLQQQMDYGLKLSGIGDQIALGAIRSGMQADQYVNNLTQQFFTNLMRGITPQVGGAAPAPAPTPPGGR